MQFVFRHANRRRACIVGALLLGLMGAPALAGSLDAAIPITLSAQPLGEGLRVLARQANLQILFDPDLVSGLSAVPISDTVSPRAALDQLLHGTRLEAHEQAPGIVVIRQRKEDSARIHDWLGGQRRWIDERVLPATLLPPRFAAWTFSALVLGSWAGR